jgi:hypothetical protein
MRTKMPTVSTAVGSAALRASIISCAVADLFWLQNRVIFSTRIVTCECVNEGKGDNALEDSPAGGDGSSPAHSKVHPPRGHILNLMIKNVSKNDPLTSSEKEVSH